MAVEANKMNIWWILLVTKFFYGLKWDTSDHCALTPLQSFLFPVMCLRKQSSHLSIAFLLNSLQLILSFAESLVWLDPFSVMDSSVANGPYFYALWSEYSLWHYEFVSWTLCCSSIVGTSGLLLEMLLLLNSSKSCISFLPFLFLSYLCL